MGARTPKTPGRNGFTYRPRYGVIVLCDDEVDQRVKYGALHAMGYALKVVCV